MQSIVNQGKNFLTLDRRLLSGYQEGDELLIRLNRKNCESRMFSVKTEVKCDRVLLSFSVVNCIDQRGRYLAEILNTQKEELHNFFVQLHIKE